MSLSAAGGPTISAADHFDAEGFTKVEAVIPHDSGAIVLVNQGPEGSLQAMIITADVYEDLTVTTQDFEAVPITLDGPMLLVGPGTIAAIGLDVDTLMIANGHVTDDRNVTVFIARTAISLGA